MLAAERVRGSLTAVRLVLAFSGGGIVGVLGATVLEVDIQPSQASTGRRAHGALGCRRPGLRHGAAHSPRRPDRPRS
jgi:hypothetical protein